ncbi:MAG: nitroreductase family protein [Acidimicrobiia bacterium]|nr:nitroreductase family protein [Acidimicrobiia bacterium]
MDVFETIGSRRSIRFYQTWRPVERWKIQSMLEAARIASHAANVNALRAIVVERDDMTEEMQNATLPVNLQLRLAPALILWFGDLRAWDAQGEKLHQLVDVGAVGAGFGWSDAFIDDFMVPMTKAAAEGTDNTAVMTALDAGLGIANAQLVATSLGLGTCLNPFFGDAEKVFGLPEGCRPWWIMTVGYPAESRDGGGQRPREPFENMFHLGRYGTEFPRDPEVVEDLEERRMLQDPAPAPWRKAELRALSAMFGLPE